MSACVSNTENGCVTPLSAEYASVTDVHDVELYRGDGLYPVSAT